MKIIPLIHIKNKKIVKLDDTKFTNIKDFIIKYEDEHIYILDHDGIRKNKPNLCLLQKLSKKYQLWVDQGPTVLGDIVDSIIAGADNITIRGKLLNIYDLTNIRDIIENKIFLNIDSHLIENDISKNFIDFDGYILFANADLLNNFKYQEYLKNIVKNNDVYVYTSDKDNIQYLNKFDFKGFLIDIEKIEE
jgi:hypothetical protein